MNTNNALRFPRQDRARIRRKARAMGRSRAADSLKLTDADLRRDRGRGAKAAMGERHPAEAMAHLDSQKRG